MLSMKHKYTVQSSRQDTSTPMFNRTLDIVQQIWQRLTYSGQGWMDDILQTTVRMKFVADGSDENKQKLVQVTAWLRPGATP